MEALTMATNPTTAGSKLVMLDPADIDNVAKTTTTELRLLAAKGEPDAKFQRMAKAVRDAYGDLDDYEVIKVCAALREIDMCDKCTGYPCRKPTSPFSKGEGFTPVIQVDERWGLSIAAKRCKPYAEHFRQVALERKFKQAKIPPSYKGKTYADYRVDALNQNAVTFGKTLLQAGYRGAYFYGEVGTGKTFLAAIIAQEFLNAGKSVLFEKVADLLTEFYAIYRGQGGDEDNLLDELYNVDLLVLDDFGIEKPTQFVGATLCKILDARYNREDVTTLITSNYTLEQIKRRLNNPSDLQQGDLCLNGSRIYDRCREICKPILFKGESRRN